MVIHNMNYVPSRSQALGQHSPPDTHLAVPSKPYRVAVRDSATKLRKRSRFNGARPCLLCIGPRPPLVFGQSLAFDTLVTAHELALAFDVTVCDLNFYGLTTWRKLYGAAKEFIKYTATAPRHRPDLVYLSFGRSTWSFLRDSLFLEREFRRGVPIVAHCHGGDFPDFWKRSSPWMRQLLRRAFRHYSKLIVVSHTFASGWSHLISSDRIVEIMNCYLPPRSLSLDQGLLPRSPDQPLSMVFLANVIPEKGFFEILGAMKLLADEHLRTQLTFVGSFVDAPGVSAESLERRAQHQIQSLGLSESVTLAGPQYNDSKWRYLLDAEVLLLPTYYSSEASPIAIIEGMAAGCAIVATRYRGLPDLFKETEGRFVEPRDCINLAATLRELAKNRDVLLALRIAASKRARAHFSRDKHVGELVGTLQEALGLV